MTDARLGRMVRTTATLTALWTVPVVIDSAGHYFGMVSEGGMPASHSIGNSIALWYVWIPATMAILWLYRRLPFSGRTWAPATLAHAAILAIVFIGQVWLSVVIGHMTGHVGHGMTFLMHAEMLMINLLLYDLFIYGGVIAVAFGLDHARRYRDRDLRASQLETQLERTRLEALQMQLQPHFLFNALNSIAMLVRRERKQEALDVVIGFGELLRYVLDESGTVDVLFQEEVRFVRRYLDIEKVRYGDRLRLALAVAPEAEGALAPNLLLQPLVENALKHGIGRLPEGGQVRISAERRGAMLHVEVANDGPILPDGFSLEATEGLGLRNLRDRLTALVGSAGAFRLANEPNGAGVVAVIDIPFREGKRERAALERVG